MPATPLPREILERPKTGFNIPVRSWLEGNGNGASHANGNGNGGVPASARRGLRGWALKVYGAAPHALAAS